MTSLVVAILVAASPDATQSYVSAGSPPEQAAPKVRAGAPSAGRPAQGAAEQQPARGETVPLAGADDVRRVCDAAALPEGTDVSGGLVERADAEARHTEERGDALATRFGATFPGERLRFARWTPGEGTLALLRHASLLTADDSLRLDPLSEPALPVRADAGTVRKILAAQRAHTLALRVTFALDDEDAPCFHVPGARTWTVSGEPLAWEYVSGEEVLARGGEGADRPTVSAKAGARPQVRLGGAEEESAKSVRGAVLARVGEIQGCYTSALDRNPWVDGSIVADLEAGGRGKPEKVRIAADTTNDEKLVACVRGVLASLDVRGQAGRAFLPIHFVLEPPGSN